MALIPPQYGSRPIAALVEQLEECVDPTTANRYGDGKGGPFDFSRQATLLIGALSAAVPLRIFELEKLGRSLSSSQFWEMISRRAGECSAHLAHHGDDLMFKSKVKGKTAEAFNRLAEGLACLSFCPGGVTAFGEHWERKVRNDLSC